MNDNARHLRERFQDKKHGINLLIAEDPEFLTLCEDHDACVDALQYWVKSKDLVVPGQTDTVSLVMSVI